MKSRLLPTLGLVVAGALATAAGSAQAPAAPRINAPAASPAATLKQRVGFTDIEVS
jgi:hypothetical protein